MVKSGKYFSSFFISSYFQGTTVLGQKHEITSLPINRMDSSYKTGKLGSKLNTHLKGLEVLICKSCKTSGN